MNPLDELIGRHADRLKTHPDEDPPRRDPAPPEPVASPAAGQAGSSPTAPVAPTEPPGAGAGDAGAEAACDRRDLPAAPAPHPAGPVPRPPSPHADLEEMARVDPEGAELHRQWRDMDQLQKGEVSKAYYRKMRGLIGLPDAEIERQLTPLERKIVFPHRPERNLPEFSRAKPPGEDPVVPLRRESAPSAQSKGADQIQPSVGNDSPKGSGSSSPSGRTLAHRPPPVRRERDAPRTRPRRGPVD